MLAVNPKYILRNFVAQMAIDDAEKGKYTTLDEIVKVLEDPYDVENTTDYSAYLTPPKWAKEIRVSCSS